MGDGWELAAEKHVRYIVTVEKVDRLSLGCELLDAAADSARCLANSCKTVSLNSRSTSSEGYNQQPYRHREHQADQRGTGPARR
ncbi:hypothetical protein OsI_36297 [Oryza sativa Indica Group]|uniref:Uncharacterized protein n=1 Tax=Oryza sativa subsp. indica TaxID=39946 RepID=B8BKS9_ORYSI|nr:hypothetical protein OsI_36297 [Oryza sativa Indica Group]